tara:strand:- start:142 stop:696 length:555 start_codon:yes stop_codon:yes gene_type:complete
MPKAREWSEEEKQWLKDNISYDTETGNLFWTTTILRGHRTGDLVGATRGSGYMSFSGNLGGKPFYYNHRVVWFLNYGSVPKMLDHIDGDKLNNRVENLRPATTGLNSRNRLAYGICKFKGVSMDKDKYFQCRANKGGKLIYIGVFKTSEGAARAYDKYVEEELTPLERQFTKTNEEMGLYDDDT